MLAESPDFATTSYSYSCAGGLVRGVDVGVGVSVTVAVGVRVGVRVDVGDAVGVAVALEVGVGVVVSVGVGVAVGVSVSMGVGVGVLGILIFNLAVDTVVCPASVPVTKTWLGPMRFDVGITVMVTDDMPGAIVTLGGRGNNNGSPEVRSTVVPGPGGAARLSNTDRLEDPLSTLPLLRSPPSVTVSGWNTNLRSLVWHP
jgi:hypothetical protein